MKTSQITVCNVYGMVGRLLPILADPGLRLRMLLAVWQPKVKSRAAVQQEMSKTEAESLLIQTAPAYQTINTILYSSDAILRNCEHAQ